MNLGRTVFSQLISFLPDREFRRCVNRYDGDRRWRGFSCWDQFLSMAFAQLTYRESLRDIEACLRSLGAKLYHMGFRGKIARSTLADANESRDWRIYADFAQVLIRIARPLYARDPIGVDLNQTLYALDSTPIDLCLSLFPWAKFRRRKAAVKMHTLLDLRGNIPTFIRITDGTVHDVNILDEIGPEPGAFLRHGSGLRRFRTPLRVHPLLVVLRRTNQEEHLAPTALLASRRQIHGLALGSDRHTDCHRIGQGLPGPVAAGQLLRLQDEQAATVPDQQLRPPGADHHPDLQVALAD